MLNQVKTVPSQVHLEDRQLQDRRRWPRIPVLTAAWLWRNADPDEPQEPLAIQILDCSDHGVGFISPVPLSIGEQVELDTEGDGTRRTRVRVTQCDFQPGNIFRIGAWCDETLSI